MYFHTQHILTLHHDPLFVSSAKNTRACNNSGGFWSHHIVWTSSEIPSGPLLGPDDWSHPAATIESCSASTGCCWTRSLCTSYREGIYFVQLGIHEALITIPVVSCRSYPVSHCIVICHKHCERSHCYAAPEFRFRNVVAQSPLPAKTERIFNCTSRHFAGR